MSTYEANRYSFSGANITALNGSNIASGTVADARIPNLATSKITSGTFADARISSSSVTAHVTAVTVAEGTWTPSPSSGGITTISAFYQRTGDLCYCYFEAYINSSAASNNDGWYMTGLPITPKDQTGGDGGIMTVGHGCHRIRSDDKRVVILDNGRIIPITTGQAMRLVDFYEDYDPGGSGYASGLVRNNTLRNRGNANDVWADRFMYCYFIYHV